MSVRRAAGKTRAVVVVLCGGQVESRAATSSWQLSAVRMIPFARSLHRAGADHGVAVWTVGYRFRGWNGAEQSPVADAGWVLGEIRRRHGNVPVVLVGHSMGGRTALRAAGDHSVHAVVALAPWLPPAEPVDQLRGRSVLILHGTRDRRTDPMASFDLAQRAATVAAVHRVEIRGVGHPMIHRARLWHGLTTWFVTENLSGAQSPSTASTGQNDPYRILGDEINVQR